MRRDPTEFRQRFNKWKAGELVYDKGRPITDDEYIGIMENVASENNPKWNEFRRNNGDPELSEDEELRRILNDNSYDYRGYYNKYPNSRANADTHWTDEFKTVYHPTFSVLSKYSGKKSQYNPEGVLGGLWLPNEVYVPAWGQKLHSLKSLKTRLQLPGFQGGTEGEIVTKLSPVLYLTNYVNSLIFEDKAKKYILSTDNYSAQSYINHARKQSREFKGIKPIVHPSNVITGVYHSLTKPYRQVARFIGNFAKEDFSNADIKEKIIYLDYDYPVQNLNSTTAHEFGHIVDGSMHDEFDYTKKSSTPYLYQNLYNKQNKNNTYTFRTYYNDKDGRESQKLNNKHDTNPHEIYADLMLLRYDLYKNNIYDSTSKTGITKELIEKYRKLHNGNNMNRILRGFDNDTVVRMINEIAYNPYSDNKSLLYAKYGKEEL